MGNRLQSLGGDPDELQTMAQCRIPIPTIPKEAEAALRTLLIEDLVDRQDIKPNTRSATYHRRAKMETYIDSLVQNDYHGLLMCYGIDVLANIVMPEYREPILQEADTFFQKLMRDVDDLKDKNPTEKRTGRRAGLETDIDLGPNDFVAFHYLADIVMPEYRELILQEADTLFQKLTTGVDDLQDIKPKKRRTCKQNQNKPCVGKIREEQEIPNESSANLQESHQTITNEIEQEQTSETCLEVNDIDRFEKSDVKPRGKIPGWHMEILTKHYPIIMENIRVNDVMDHLFSEKLIDWNEKDVIDTKLKSEGNREALNYFMKILFNCRHTGLPTFLRCLNKTGYFQLAERLQNDMDSENGVQADASSNCVTLTRKSY